MNKYLNGYAGKLGCSTEIGQGEIVIDRREYVNARSQQASNTINLFFKKGDDRAVPEI